MKITNAMTREDEGKLRFTLGKSIEYVVWMVVGPEYPGAGRLRLLQIGKRGKPLSPRVQANFWNTSQTELLALIEAGKVTARGRCEEMVYTKP